MTHNDSSQFAVSLPHHKLDVYRLSLELVALIHNINIGSIKDRARAREASASCARNIAEGAGRTSAADKARVYGIARGECVEAIACVEVAFARGRCRACDLARVVALGGRISAMLARLIK